MCACDAHAGFLRVAGFCFSCGLPLFIQQLKKETAVYSLATPCCVSFHHKVAHIVQLAHLSDVRSKWLLQADRFSYIHTSCSLHLLVYPDIGLYHNPLGLGKLPHSRMSCSQKNSTPSSSTAAPYFNM